MASHTPGPWVLQSCENELRYIVTDSRTESHVIAGPYSVQLPMIKGEDNSETLSNARLIAAAPELAEALKALIAAYLADKSEDYAIGPEVKAARAAIQKARG